MHSAHEFLLSGKPSSYPLGGFSVPLEVHFLKKKSAIVYLFVYFLRFAEKSSKTKIFKKVKNLTVNKEKVPQNNRLRYCFLWSEWRDLNPRPLGPEPSAIPNFATPRNTSIIMRAVAPVKTKFRPSAIMDRRPKYRCGRASEKQRARIPFPGNMPAFLSSGAEKRCAKKSFSKIENTGLTNRDNLI